MSHIIRYLKCFILKEPLRISLLLADLKRQYGIFLLSKYDYQSGTSN